MKNSNYERFIKGFFINNCAIVDKNKLLFVVYEVNNDPSSSMSTSTVKLVSYDFNPEKIGQLGWTGGTRYLKISYDSNEERSIVVDFDSGIWESKQDNYNFPLYELPNKKNTFSIHDLITIDKTIYAVGRPRKLFKRTSHKQWLDITDPKKFPLPYKDIEKAKKSGRILDLDFGFNSADGFNEKDIYACGDAGDLWHFNGSNWRQLDIPCNVSLNCILCADDGFVYIAGDLGVIYKGINDKWEKIEQSLTKVSFINITSFKGILYISTENGLYQYKDYIFWRVGFDKGDIQTSFNWVTSNSEILVSYGPDQALVFDGNKWIQVIGPPSKQETK